VLLRAGTRDREVDLSLRAFGEAVKRPLVERDTAPEPSIWAAYGLGMLLAIQTQAGGAVQLAALGGLFVGFLVTSRFRLGWWGIAGLVVAGIALRLGVSGPRASDVLDVTSAAVQQVFAGLDPYGHGYLISRPPGAPFPYGPIALLWYAPAMADPHQLEVFVSCGIIALFAIRGRPIGLAAYAMAPTLIATAADGSNDTSAGLLLLIALVVAARRPGLGGALLAVAVAFKPYALAWVPALLAYGGPSSLLGFAAVTAAAWVPTFWVWGVDNYLTSLHGADLTHRSAYWSVAVIYEAFTQRVAPHALLDQIRLLVAGVVTLGGLFLVRTIDRVIVVGTVVFVIMMFGGFWGSYAYIGAIGPIICWRLDDWLRVPAPDFIASKAWAPAFTPATDVVVAPPVAEPPVVAPREPNEPVPPGDGLDHAPTPAPAFSSRKVARS